MGQGEEFGQWGLQVAAPEARSILSVPAGRTYSHDYTALSRGHNRGLAVWDEVWGARCSLQSPVNPSLCGGWALTCVMETPAWSAPDSRLRTPEESCSQNLTVHVHMLGPAGYSQHLGEFSVDLGNCHNQGPGH